MKWAIRLGWIGTFAMTLVLVNGFVNGDFSQDGSLLLKNPWGIVSLVDLYVGFFLFSAWIFYREKTILSSLIWSLAMMVFGFLTGSIYVLYAAFTSGKNTKRFWLGKHYEK